MIGRLSLAEDDLGKAVAEGTVVVEFREAEILEGEVADAVEGRVDAGCAAAHVFEQAAKVIFVH